MNLEKIEQYIQRIQNTKVDDIDMNELKGITREVLEDFNAKGPMDIVNDKTGIALKEHIFLTILAHKYTCKMYNNKIDANFLPTGQAQHSHYSAQDKTINYVLNYLEVTQGGFRNIFHVMHENRHAVQFKQFEMEPSDILVIDPLSIVMLKETFINRYEPELYNKNHKSFIMENDANVCAYEHFNEFFEKYFPDLKEKALVVENNYNPDERDNYAGLLEFGSDIGDYKFSESKEGTLPVIYEADRQVKRNISREDIKIFPLLKLIYKEDGTPKSYKEIKEDEKKAKSMHLNDKPVKRKDSISEFKENETRPSNKHIEKVYQYIINSDPMLFFEDCLNRKDIRQIKDLFECTPELMEVYKSEIKSTLRQYININNYEKLQEIFHNLNDKNIENAIEGKIKSIVKNDVEKQFGIKINAVVENTKDEIKNVDTLNNEENEILEKLLKSVNDGEFEPKKYGEYKKIIHKIYDGYRDYSIEDNPNQFINNENKNFENEISSRGEEKQIQDFNLEFKHHDYTENELSEKYSRHLKGEDKELAKMFAHFQKVKKGENYFEYEDTELQNIVEYKDIDGETCYDIIYRNSIENDGIVQTYTKDENGKLKLYSEKEYDDFYQEMSNYDNKDKSFSIEDAKIKMKKALIEDALGKERVTEITEITDTKFLEDFAKQTGQGENGLYNATIVSSINEKGEEDYDIVFADYSINRISTMPGIKALNKDRHNIQIDSGMSIPTQDGQKGGKIYDSITNLKKFETPDGHRYAISRDSKGKLGFTEIFKEKEQLTFGKNVNTYTFEDLKETYRSKKINQTDLNKAFDTINRTKQQQQTKGEMNLESEGR